MPLTPRKTQHTRRSAEPEGKKEAARSSFRKQRDSTSLSQNMQAGYLPQTPALGCSKKGKLTPRIERFKAAGELDPTNAQAYYHLATALHRSGQVEAARSSYQKAKELDPRLKPLPEQ